MRKNGEMGKMGEKMRKKLKRIFSLKNLIAIFSIFKSDLKPLSKFTIKMTDFNSIMFSQMTDLQMRISKQESTIIALKGQIDRLSGQTNVTPMRISVPLNNGRPPRAPRDRDSRARDPRDRKPRVGTPYPTMSLSDVIEQDEQVTIQIKTVLNDGVQEYATALTVFDGTDLEVTDCELVDSLVGLKSSKPGEILYKFMEALKDAGHIKNTFGIAPWRLCFVERNGVKKTLEELRSNVG